MSILLQKKNVGDYSYMSSPNIYYRALKKTKLESLVFFMYLLMQFIAMVYVLRR